MVLIYRIGLLSYVTTPLFILPWVHEKFTVKFTLLIIRESVDFCVGSMWRQRTIYAILNAVRKYLTFTDYYDQSTPTQAEGLGCTIDLHMVIQECQSYGQYRLIIVS